ncbi:MAG TPA: GDSL-type esterase/lipase family protein [Edaphobacter sp.]
MLFAFTAPGIAAVRVFNEGVPGESSAEVDSRLDTALKRYAPQYVVIFVGMNDAVNDKKFLPPGTTAEHVAAMIHRSQVAGAEVVLVSVHEPDVARLLQRHKVAVYGDTSPAERIRRLNWTLEQTARQNHASLADFHSTLIKVGGPTQEWSTDGVHLTARGYALLAKTVLSSLPRHMADNASVLCIGDSLTYGIGVRPAGGMTESDQTYPAVLQRFLNNR